MTNHAERFTMPAGAFLVAVNDEWSVTLEISTKSYESPAAALEANDDFEDADRVFLCLPAMRRMVDIREELAEAWLTTHRDYALDDLLLMDAVNGVHGKVMRWLVSTAAYERRVEELHEATIEHERYGSCEEQHRLRAHELV